MAAMHCEFGLFALRARHHQHLCMSACIPGPWATYSKQLTGHEFYLACADKCLVRSGAPPPPLGGLELSGGSTPDQLKPPGRASLGVNRGLWSWGGLDGQGGAGYVPCHLSSCRCGPRCSVCVRFRLFSESHWLCYEQLVAILRPMALAQRPGRLDCLKAHLLLSTGQMS